MRWPLFWTLTLTAWALQVTLAGRAGAAGIPVDFLAAAAVAAAIAAPDLRAAFLAGWSAGILRDLSGVGPPGLCSLWLPAAALALRAATEWLDARAFGVRLLLAAGGSLTVLALEGAILYVTVGALDVLPTAASAAAAAPATAALVIAVLAVADRAGALAPMAR